MLFPSLILVILIQMLNFYLVESSKMKNVFPYSTRKVSDQPECDAEDLGENHRVSMCC